MEDSLAHFMTITAASAEMAQKYLQVCIQSSYISKVSDADLEQAISLFFANNGAELTSTDNYVQPIPEQHRAPIAPSRAVLTHSSSFGENQTDWIDDPFVIRGQQANRMHSNYNLPNNNPFDDNDDEDYSHLDQDDDMDVDVEQSSKSKLLSQMFRLPTDIMFKRGDLEMAKLQAQKENKFILITIHDHEQFCCLAMIRDLWNKDVIKTFIKEKFIFLFYKLDSREGQLHKNFYPIDNFPYAAIMDPLTGARLHQWNRLLEPTEFITDVEKFIFARKPQSSKDQPQKKKLVSELSEEEQLNLALQASLESSKMIIPGFGSNSDPYILEHEDVKGKGKFVEKAVGFDSIKPVVKPEPTVGDDITKIQFKLPDGQRLVRRFKKEDKVRDLFEFVMGQVPVVKDQKFDLVAFRKSLVGDLEISLDGANLLNSIVMVDFL